MPTRARAPRVRLDATPEGLFAKIPAAAAGPLHDFFRELSLQALDHARDHAKTQHYRRQARQRNAGLRKIPAMVQALIDAGDPVESAIASIVAGGIAEATVRIHWDRHQRGEATRARRRRNQEIVRLARRGLTNKEIAARVGLRRAATVSEIIKKELQ